MTTDDNQYIDNELDDLFGEIDDKELVAFNAKMIQLDFIQMLDGILKDKDISYAVLANKLGVSKSYISQLYSAKKKINLTTLSKLCKILDIEFEIKPKMRINKKLKKIDKIKYLNSIEGTTEKPIAV